MSVELFGFEVTRQSTLISLDAANMGVSDFQSPSLPARPKDLARRDLSQLPRLERLGESGTYGTGVGRRSSQTVPAILVGELREGFPLTLSITYTLYDASEAAVASLYVFLTCSITPCRKWNARSNGVCSSMVYSKILVEICRCSSMSSRGI